MPRPNPEPTTRALPRIGSFAPGAYLVMCSVCGGDFTGDKRALSCLNCAIDDLLMAQPDIKKGLSICAEGKAYEDESPGELAAMAAYTVLRCCNLIGAGDNRVPERIGRTVAAMLGWRARNAQAGGAD